ncbi:hypothetical protein ISG33_14335 [Glaciecola sp. MH2013]|uniref:hypothetical protein n=1 Tax=Glaciecola sp. MH2013 TaxID=2785524 RepID=UPI00189FDE82|nr:hypothetical protein [Glaciecola sp. MH2013]MBF7074580.1 hypothetical protein [Glaciecola sp. MH2013]
MGLIEAILLGIQFKRLEKPIVFFTMLLGLILFIAFGVVIVLATLDSIFNSKVEVSSEIVAPFFGILASSFVFFGLAWACGYMIKRCF